MPLKPQTYKVYTNMNECMTQTTTTTTTTRYNSDHEHLNKIIVYDDEEEDEYGTNDEIVYDSRNGKRFIEKSFTTPNVSSILNSSYSSNNNNNNNDKSADEYDDCYTISNNNRDKNNSLEIKVKFYINKHPQRYDNIIRKHN